jgi:hypothetical protein
MEEKEERFSMITGFTILTADFMFANVISWSTDISNATVQH